MKTQKTYKGKTAGGWLKAAKIEQMRSGDYVITNTFLPGAQISIDIYGCMFIKDCTHTLARLACSARAEKDLSRLVKLADDMTLAAIK